MKLGVVDTGGGLRGVYAAGVFDYCLDAGIKFDFCIGVSAGSANITSYMAGQKKWNYAFYTDYPFRKEYMSVHNMIHKRSYQDRATLWNAVEKAERGKKAQLAYSFDIALQNEFSLEENIALARQFVSEQLVSRGMVADFAIHQPDKEDGGIPNPHFHVLCPIRPIEESGKWGFK